MPDFNFLVVISWEIGFEGAKSATFRVRAIEESLAIDKAFALAYGNVPFGTQLKATAKRIT